MDECPVCGLPTHADADAGLQLCRRCYWWFDEYEIERFERWVEDRKIEELKGEN